MAQTPLKEARNQLIGNVWLVYHNWAVPDTRRHPSVDDLFAKLFSFLNDFQHVSLILIIWPDVQSQVCVLASLAGILVMMQDILAERQDLLTLFVKRLGLIVCPLLR